MGVGNDIALTLLIEASDLASPILAKLATSFGPIGVAAAVAGAAVVGFAAESVKMAGDFQASITKLYTTAGEAKSNLQMVSDGILAMSASVGTSAQQLVQAMYWIESGNLHGAAALEALRVAAEAAKAENANLNSVSIALAASLNAYAGSGMTAVQVMNTLTAATGQGMMSFEQLSGSLANVLPASAKFGISLTDVTAALATMTAQGDPAAQAATHLKQMILALEAPSKIGAAALASVGLTSQQVAAEMKISLPDALKMITDAVGKKFPESSAAYKQAIKDIAGGNKQMMGFLELTGKHMGTFASDVDKISAAVKAGGNNLMGWADIQKNFNFQVDAAKAGLDALMITIGLKLLPVLTAIVQYGIVPFIAGLTWLVNNGGQFVAWFQGASAGAQALKFAMLALVAAGIVFLVTLLPGLIAGFIGLAAAAWAAAAGVIAATWPFVLIGLAIAGLIVLVVKLYQNWTEFRNFVNLLGVGLQNLWKWILQVASAFGTWLHTNVLPWLQEFWNWIQTKALPALQEFWNWLYVKLGAAFSALGTWINGTAIPALQLFWQWIQNKIVPVLQVVWQWLVTKVGAAFSALGTFIQSQVIPALQTFWSFVQTKIIPALQAFWQKLQDVWSVIVTNLKPVFDALGKALQNLWNTIQTQVVPTLQQLWSTIQTQLVPVLRQLWSIIQTQLVPIFLQLWNTIQTQVVPALKNFWTAIQPILPDLKLLGALILGLLILALTFFVSALAGVVGAITSFLTGLNNLLKGIGNVFDGIGTMAHAFWQGIQDLFTGNFSKLGTDWNNFWTGVGKFFTGIGQIIQGIWQMTIGAVLQGIGTFIHTATGLFQGFSKVLVGHSIIPDMLNAILSVFTTTFSNILSIITGWINAVISFFQSLASVVEGAIGAMWSNVVGQFNSASSTIIGIVQNLASNVGNIINGILNNISNVGNGVGNLGGLGGGGGFGSFATGVENFGGGLAYVHQGEVLMNLSPGTSVIPASRVSFNTNSTSGGNIYITAVGSTKEQIQQISDAIDKKWGRNYRRQYGPVANGGGTL